MKWRHIISECDEEFPCEGLGEHAHFRSFGMAYLTLFRIATGEYFNNILLATDNTLPMQVTTGMAS